MQYSILIQYDSTDHIYIATVPELPGCMAHGRTPKEALREVSIVCEMWIEEAEKVGKAVPLPALERNINFSNVLQDALKATASAG